MEHFASENIENYAKRNLNTLTQFQYISSETNVCKQFLAGGKKSKKILCQKNQQKVLKNTNSDKFIYNFFFFDDFMLFLTTSCFVQYFLYFSCFV